MANRPLSPHLQVYRPQFTSVLSILHRASGILLATGSLLIIWWLWSIMSGAAGYATAHAFFNSIIGKFLMFVWTLCMFYHLANGVRHLVWDTGNALEISEAYLAGKIVVATAIVMTLLAWVL